LLEAFETTAQTGLVPPTELQNISGCLLDGSEVFVTTDRAPIRGATSLRGTPPRCALQREGSCGFVQQRGDSLFMKRSSTGEIIELRPR